MNKKNVAIIIAMNDLEDFHGGSLNGIKNEISYFDQFLILYTSIKTNWKKIFFEYDIYLLHSIHFSDEKNHILTSLDIKVIHVNYPNHPIKIRPMCYKIDIDCDYRLVLDTDMLAIKEPNLDFSYDALGMYGGNKYSLFQWKKIVKHIGCNLPEEPVRYFKKGKYNTWSFKEHYNYQIGNMKKKRFPYFNNGAILIKNDLSLLFVEKWECYRESYTDFVKNEFDIDIDKEGQDVVGLAIANTTENWGIFKRGMNFINQEMFKLGKKLINDYDQEVYLLHYINITPKSKYYSQVHDTYNIIREKYYI